METEDRNKRQDESSKVKKKAVFVTALTSVIAALTYLISSCVSCSGKERSPTVNAGCKNACYTLTKTACDITCDKLFHSTPVNGKSCMETDAMSTLKDTLNNMDSSSIEVDKASLISNLNK